MIFSQHKIFIRNIFLRKTVARRVIVVNSITDTRLDFWKNDFCATHHFFGSDDCLTEFTLLSFFFK